MSVQLNTALEKKVAELEEKSERIEREKQTETRVEHIGSRLRQINQKLDSIEETAAELAYYVKVLENVFDPSRLAEIDLSRPEEVESAIASARTVVGIDDDELLDLAENQQFANLQQRLQDVDDELSDAIDAVSERIKEAQSVWFDELSAARELNQIIGSQDDEFQRVLDDLNRFLTQTIWNVDEDPAALAARWERLVERWDEHAGKHGWETFKDEHGLSEKTIEELKQFSGGGSVSVSDISVQTYREVKNVPELRAALRFELRNQ